jgi:hypothetical protein
MRSTIGSKMYQNFLPPLTYIIDKMKLILDIKDNKALHLMEILKSLPYVSTKAISDEKALLIEEIKGAVENIKLVRQGKLEARPARDLLNEL